MVSGLVVTSLLAIVTIAGGGGESNSPLVEDVKLQAGGMYRYWQARLPLAPGDRAQEAYLIDEALYVITDGGSLFALTAETGLIRWAEKLTEANYRIYRPAHIRTADGFGPVVIPTTTEVFVYDRFSGDLLKRFRPEFAVGSAAVAYDDNLFMGSSDGRFYSLKINHPQARKPYKRWTVLAGGPVTAAPILYHRNMLLFASQSGTVFSCRAADKFLNWSFRAGGPVVGDPAVDASGAYVASTDRSLYKLDLADGTVIWRVRMPRPLTEGPIVTAHTVFQYCTASGISAIDADTGKTKWRIADGRAFVAHTRSGDVILTRDTKSRRLVLVDHERGEVRRTIDAEAVVATVTNTLNDALYMLGGRGRVLCARLDSVPYLRRQQVIAARARLNLPSLDEARAEPALQSAVGGSDSTLIDPLRSRRDVRP